MSIPLGRVTGDMGRSFTEVMGIPEFLHPHLDVIADEDEQALVVAIDEAGGKANLDKLASALDLTPEAAQDLLDRAFSKNLIHKVPENGSFSYVLAMFTHRMSNMAIFEEETFDGLPEDVLEQYKVWDTENYCARIRKGMAEGTLHHKPYIVPIEHFIDYVDTCEGPIHVVPCDCRRIHKNCNKPNEACIAFADSPNSKARRRPDKARELSREEAKELIRELNRKGLVHSINSNYQTDGLVHMCNCCSTCCYQLRGAEIMGLKGEFVLTPYLAQHDTDTCNHCGACVRRCPFEAFYHDGDEIEVEGRIRKHVSFNPEACYGCGVCATTCPTDAISLHQR